MKASVIRAGKVTLRPKRLEDAQDDYDWRCDEELASLDAASPLKQEFSQFVRIYEDELRFSSPWSVRYGIDTLEGKHIGNCMCYEINSTRGEAELGIMIGNRDYWSQSYGYHSIVGLVEHLFQDAELRRLYLHTLDWNIRAQRSFKKCGFSPVRAVHRFGREMVLMDLTRDYWREMRDEKLAPLRQVEAMASS